MRTPQPITRVAWVEYAFAFGIFFVVLGHVNSGIAKTPGLLMGDGLKLLNGFIYSFHMPLFFMLAGYIVHLRKQASTDNVVKDAIWSLAVPYLVWSVLWIALKAALSDFTDNPVTLSRIATILWEPVGHMWFLFHLFFIRLAWHGLERVLPFKGRMAVLVACALASMVCVSFGATWVPTWHYLHNLAFFGFGLLVLPYLDMPQTQARSFALAVLGLCAWGVAYPAINALNGPMTGLLLGLIGSLTVILMARALPQPQNIGLRLMAYMGEAAMAIYVMHLFVTTATRKGLAAAGHLSEASVLLLATPLGIVVPALVLWCIFRASSLSGVSLARYFGLGLMRNSRYLSASVESGPRATADVAGPALEPAVQQGR
ncbi:MAG: acyltransferase family protein [Hyphomicrobiaceae bacterium]